MRVSPDPLENYPFMLRSEVLQEIYQAIARVNEIRGLKDQIPCREDTLLYGPEGGLDSLGLVSLILDVEQAVNERTKAALTLADAQAMGLRRNPFRDVRSLADHVMSRLAGTPPCPARE
jgi:acyl carrier protein